MQELNLKSPNLNHCFCKNWDHQLRNMLLFMSGMYIVPLILKNFPPFILKNFPFFHHFFSPSIPFFPFYLFSSFFSFLSFLSLFFLFSSLFILSLFLFSHP